MPQAGAIEVYLLFLSLLWNDPPANIGSLHSSSYTHPSLRIFFASGLFLSASPQKTARVCFLTYFISCLGSLWLADN